MSVLKRLFIFVVSLYNTFYWTWGQAVGFKKRRRLESKHLADLLLLLDSQTLLDTKTMNMTILKADVQCLPGAVDAFSQSLT